MNKKFFLLILLLCAFLCSATGQKIQDNPEIDMMLIRGDYERVIDTCDLVLQNDSLNAPIWYKKGLAYQNILPDDKSFDCFLKASEIDPDNNLYRYMVAKDYYGRGQNMKARPLLTELCASDSMNWRYAFYLTGMYLKDGKYDDAINVYKRFYDRDSTNYIILDKLGYAFFKKGEYLTAIDFYNRSMAIRENNISTIKNLSYLYQTVNRPDTAIILLTRGIELDPYDIDLYIRRGSIYFSRGNSRARADYLKILSLGDSSALYLKRAGIGFYSKNEYLMAIRYLNIASKKDTTDYETLELLAKSYHELNDLKKTEYYYNKIIDVLGPAVIQLSATHSTLGNVYIEDKNYNEAIANLLKSDHYYKNPGMIWIVGYLYDEKLNNPSKAIYYYRQCLTDNRNSGYPYSEDELKNVRDRLEYLEKQQKAGK
ncbi:MAG TPA: tetratricopeptide repeat protein [Bacteroidales bacterium]|nr:tetratricopeptide repeat protein [Bacteroidales bacterium]